MDIMHGAILIQKQLNCQVYTINFRDQWLKMVLSEWKLLISARTMLFGTLWTGTTELQIFIIIFSLRKVHLYMLHPLLWLCFWFHTSLKKLGKVSFVFVITVSYFQSINIRIKWTSIIFYFFMAFLTSSPLGLLSLMFGEKLWNVYILAQIPLSSGIFRLVQSIMKCG